MGVSSATSAMEGVIMDTQIVQLQITVNYSSVMERAPHNNNMKPVDCSWFAALHLMWKHGL